MQTICNLFVNYIKVFHSSESPNLIDTLSTWGPEYKVSLELKVNSFPTPAEGWAEVLRFTDSDTLDIRVPAMFLNSAGFLEINPFHGGSVNRTYPGVEIWHTYEMIQYFEENKV